MKRASLLFILTVLISSGNAKPSVISSKPSEYKMYRGAVVFPYHDQSKLTDMVQDYGMNLIRFSCHDDDATATHESCFLVGNSRNYTGLVPEDLARIDLITQKINELGVEPIIEIHNLPGRVWSSIRPCDSALFQDTILRTQAVEFWGDMTRHFKGAHGWFNLLNEPNYWNPYTEDIFGWDAFITGKTGGPTSETVAALKARLANTPGDLNELYKRSIAMIRSIDSTRKIIIDPELWSDPHCMEMLDPVLLQNGEIDQNVFYAFHFYSPDPLTSMSNEFKSGTYPGVIVSGWDDTQLDTTLWNKDRLREIFNRVEKWRTTNGISSNQILCTEFGITRWAPGAEQWLTDVVSLLNEYRYSWTYYAFREEGWDNMDLELGTDRKNHIRLKNSPLMKVIKRGIEQQR